MVRKSCPPAVLRLLWQRGASPEQLCVRQPCSRQALWLTRLPWCCPGAAVVFQCFFALETLEWSVSDSSRFPVQRSRCVFLARQQGKVLHPLPMCDYSLLFSPAPLQVPVSPVCC